MVNVSFQLSTPSSSHRFVHLIIVRHQSIAQKVSTQWHSLVHPFDILHDSPTNPFATTDVISPSSPIRPLPLLTTILFTIHRRLPFRCSIDICSYLKRPGAECRLPRLSRFRRRRQNRFSPCHHESGAAASAVGGLGGRSGCC